MTKSVIGVIIIFLVGGLSSYLFYSASLLGLVCVIGGILSGIFCSVLAVTPHILMVKRTGFGDRPDALDVCHWRVHMLKAPSHFALLPVMKALEKVPNCEVTRFDPCTGTFIARTTRWWTVISRIKVEVQPVDARSCYISIYVRGRTNVQLIDNGENLKTIEFLSSLIEQYKSRFEALQDFQVQIPDGDLPWHGYPDTYTFPNILQPMDYHLLGARE